MNKLFLFLSLLFVSALVTAEPSMKIKEMALGDDHTCALTESKDLYCWGSNSNGQIGSLYMGSKEPNWVWEASIKSRLGINEPVL